MPRNGTISSQTHDHSAPSQSHGPAAARRGYTRTANAINPTATMPQPTIWFSPPASPSPSTARLIRPSPSAAAVTNVGTISSPNPMAAPSHSSTMTPSVSSRYNAIAHEGPAYPSVTIRKRTDPVSSIAPRETMRGGTGAYSSGFVVRCAFIGRFRRGIRGLVELEQLLHRVQVRGRAVRALGAAEGGDRVVQQLVHDPARELFQVRPLGGRDGAELVERALQLLSRRLVVPLRKTLDDRAHLAGAVPHDELLDVPRDDRASGVHRPAALRPRVRHHLLEVVEVVEVNVLQLPDGRLDVARECDVDHEDRPVPPLPAQAVEPL